MTETDRDGIEQDVSDLRRGVAIQYLGYLVKIATPIITILVVRAYGKAPYGIFVVCQAALIWLMRASLLGLDKGLIWWVARQEVGHETKGVLSVACRVGALSALAALCLMSLSDYVADLIGASEAGEALRWMAPGVVPMTIAEVFVAASHGRRRVEVQVIIKDFLMGFILAISALAFFYLGWSELGLAWAFLVSTIVACVGAIFAWCIVAKPFQSAGFPGISVRLPGELVRFSLPMWMAELTNALVQRLDMFIVAHAADPATLGVYAVVVQIANTIRSIRQAFDSIAIAILSGVSKTGDLFRLRHNFSYATMLVCGTQMPVYAALIAFVPWLLTLYGPGFDAGTNAVLILCAFWMLNGVIGLNGLLVIGQGHSRFVLYNTLATLFVLAYLLVLFVPENVLEGAAWAVAITYCLQNSAWLFQSIWSIKAWPYTRAVLPPLVYGTAGGAAMALVWVTLASSGALIARSLGFAAFMLVYALGVWVEYRAGRLSGRLE